MLCLNLFIAGFVTARKTDRIRLNGYIYNCRLVVNMCLFVWCLVKCVILSSVIDIPYVIPIKSTLPINTFITRRLMAYMIISKHYSDSI